VSDANLRDPSLLPDNLALIPRIRKRISWVAAHSDDDRKSAVTEDATQEALIQYWLASESVETVNLDLPVYRGIRQAVQDRFSKRDAMGHAEDGTSILAKYERTKDGGRNPAYGDWAHARFRANRAGGHAPPDWLTHIRRRMEWASLDPQERSYLAHLFYNGMTVSQTADWLGITPRALRKRLQAPDYGPSLGGFPFRGVTGREWRFPVSVGLNGAATDREQRLARSLQRIFENSGSTPSRALA